MVGAKPCIVQESQAIALQLDDLLGRSDPFFGCLGDTPEKKRQPLFPSALEPHVHQAVVVFLPVPFEVIAQVKNGF